MTISEAYQVLRKHGRKLYNQREADQLARTIMADAFGISLKELMVCPGQSLNTEKADSLEKIVKRLAKGEPVQYITGKAHFMGLVFRVNPSVLIPRPETEELVDWVIRDSENQKIKHILDIGTGSGCIAIVLKKHFPEARVTAIDISERALKTATQNARIHGCEIHFVKADILASESVKLFKGVDLVVSNPPYVTQTEKSRMNATVLDHEPAEALFVPANRSALFYEAITACAMACMKTGRVFFELNEFDGYRIATDIGRKWGMGFHMRKDLQGKFRMMRLELQCKA